jgi:hypothetical protein
MQARAGGAGARGEEAKKDFFVAWAQVAPPH